VGETKSEGEWEGERERERGRERDKEGDTKTEREIEGGRERYKRPKKRVRRHEKNRLDLPIKKQQFLGSLALIYLLPPSFSIARAHTHYLSHIQTHTHTLSLSHTHTDKHSLLSLSLPKLKSSVLRWKLQVKLICIFVRFISFQTLEKSSKILLPLVWQRSKSLQSGLILREITN